MKILMSPSKTVDVKNMREVANDINSKFFNDKLIYLREEGIVFDNFGLLSKEAVKLYNGTAFKQLTDLDDDFYKDVVILSSLYGFSYGSDYISSHRLDYTTKQGRMYRKEFYTEINEILLQEDVVYNLASKEFSKGIVHPNLVNFDFILELNGKYKSISAHCKKLRGQMVKHIKENGTKFKLFSFDGYDFESYEEETKTYTFIKHAL